MGTGYTRNDTPNNIADGNVINASDLDGEFDAIQSAFNGSTGHSHDGTTGEGPQIATAGLADNAVTTAKITDANVTLAKMAANSVDSDQYVDGSIDTAHIGNLQVTTAKIAADAIDGTKLADDAVDSEHYTDGSIDRVHLAADIVDGTKIADDSIDSEHYVDGSIDTAHIADDAVTSAKLDTNIAIAGTLGVTGVSSFADGSNSAPSLTFTSDTNTGIYRGGTDILKFVTAGTDAITIDASQDVTLAGSLNFADNEKAIFGASDDLQIYHDGPDSIIAESGAGSLQLRGTNVEILNAQGTEKHAEFITNDKVGLRYNNLEKLATTSTGIDVTGTATMDGLTVDGNALIRAATGSGTLNIVSSANVSNAGNKIAFFGANRFEADEEMAFIQPLLVSNNGGSGNVQSGHLTFGTSGSEACRIDSDGNVGIGISNPSVPLDVNGITRTTNAYSLSYAGVPGSTSAFGAGTISADANWGMYFKATTGSAIADFAWVAGAGTERMRIDSSGDISFYEDTGTTPKLFWDASEEALGIGTSSPSKTLDVDGQLRIRNGGATGYGLLEYGASATATNNWHVGSEGSGSFRFYNGNFGAGSERMRITSDGNVGIGVTPFANNIGKGLDIASGAGMFGSSNSNYLTGNLYYSSGWKYKASGSGSLLLLDGNGDIKFNNATSGTADGTATLTERIRILSTGGITFNGDTATANALDDYEEGTFTPTLTFGGGSVGITYLNQTGKYTKIGNTVSISIAIILSNKGSSTGTALITSLPFAVTQEPAYSVYVQSVSFADMLVLNSDAGTNINLREVSNAGTTTLLNDTNFANDSMVRVSGTYILT
jgi:hypothetical protein